MRRRRISPAPAALLCLASPVVIPRKLDSCQSTRQWIQLQVRPDARLFLTFLPSSFYLLPSYCLSKGVPMPQRLVYFNGSYVSERDARISIFDSALMFGDMVFEMTRSFKQKPYRLRNHMDRLYASMKYARIDCGLSIEEMESATEETIERNLPRAGGPGLSDYAQRHPGRPSPV